MGLPKVNINQHKSGTDRSEELSDLTNINSTNLPPSILIEDLDQGIKDFVTNDINLIIDGKPVPVIWMNNERWAEFERTWTFQDSTDQATMPYIMIKKTTPSIYGTNPITKYNVPQNKTFQYKKVPIRENGVEGYDIYSVPIPTATNITVDVLFFSHYIQDLNIMNQKMLRIFSSRQAYPNIKGYYIPLILDEITDGSVQDDIEGQKFYMQTYVMTLQGFIQDESDFKIKKSIRKTNITYKVGN